MPGTFELKKTTSGAFMFNLKAGNHEIILTSERYTSKAGVENGITSVRKNSSDDSKYDRRTAKDDSPYFVLKAGNGEVIGKSEMYSSVAAMENEIASVKRNGVDAVLKDLA